MLSTGGPIEAYSLEASGIETLDAAVRTASRERVSQQSGVMKAVFDTGAQMMILSPFLAGPGGRPLSPVAFFGRTVAPVRGF